MVSGGDDRGCLPPVPAELVIPAEASADGGSARVIEPRAAVALRAPLAHARDIGDELVDLFRRRCYLDGGLAALRRRHSCSPPACPLGLVPDFVARANGSQRGRTETPVSELRNAAADGPVASHGWPA